jgi:TPP-dependent pyruvate/acetoin dehydrogenase alpha subunit
MHIADFGVGMLGANGVVAAGIPIATGAAQALKLQGKDAIVACFFGDGAINRGPFLEGLNWAQVYGLPVLFVCEDNRIAATTPTRSMTAGEGAAARARALGIEAREVDGNDVEAVDAARPSWWRGARRPAALLHAVTYRIKGHVSVDPGAYRDADEVERARQDDPLPAPARCSPRSASGRRNRGDRRRGEARDRAALAAADAAPWPAPEAAFEDVISTGAGQWR